MLILTEKVKEELMYSDILLEGADNTYTFRDNFYPTVERILSTSSGQKRFTNFVSSFINRNSSKLTTIGPMYQIPFTFEDKKAFFDLFELNESDVVAIVKKTREALKTSVPSWQSITQNPVFVIMYFVIRYFTITKNPKQLNNALVIMALAIYPSIYYKYFRNWTINTGTMQYTIDNLSQRFIIKKSSHIFGALTYSVQGSWKFHEKNIIDGNDENCVQFAWRIHNDQNSLIKKIAQNYMSNKSKGLTVITDVDAYDDNSVVDVENNTNKVSAMVDKIILQCIMNGVDLRLCDFAANASETSKIELRNYLTKIICEKNSEDMKSFIESILFLYLYNGQHTYEEINSKQFLTFALALFKKTNSKDENIVNIKKLLDKWGNDSGIYGKFSRIPTRVIYTKGIFLYFILAIQKHS